MDLLQRKSTYIVHHLHEGDEENDSAERVDVEPMLANRIRVEEELSTDEALVQEIAGERRNPLEDLETSIALQHKERDCLLEEQSDNNGRPWDCLSVRGREVKTELENEESEHGDRTVSIARILFFTTENDFISVWARFMKVSLTPWRGKPYAEPNTIASRQSQPIVSRTL